MSYHGMGGVSDADEKYLKRMEALLDTSASALAKPAAAQLPSFLKQYPVALMPVGCPYDDGAICDTAQVLKHRPIAAELLRLAKVADAERATIAARWKGVDYKRLGLPPQAVVDAIVMVRDRVINPWNSTVQAFADANPSLASWAEDLGRMTRTKLWPKQLEPLLRAAQKAVRAGAKVMPVTIPGYPKQTLVSVVSLVLVDIADDAREAYMKAMSKGVWASLADALYRNTAFIRSGISAVFDKLKGMLLDLVQPLVEAAVDVAEATASALDKFVKYSLVAGGLFVVYKLRTSNTER